jgi:hypothetical protein
VSRVQGFPPIVSEQSKLLILGSMPGAVSLKAGQYYAHPRNAFWSIMGEPLRAGPSLPYQERVAILQSVGVALWDSLQACISPLSCNCFLLNYGGSLIKRSRNVVSVQRVLQEMRRAGLSDTTIASGHLVAAMTLWQRELRIRGSEQVANKRYLLKQLFDGLFDRCWDALQKS